MMKSQANKEVAVDDKLFTLPVNAGRAIVEAGAATAGNGSIYQILSQARTIN